MCCLVLDVRAVGGYGFAAFLESFVLAYVFSPMTRAPLGITARLLWGKAELTRTLVPRIWHAESL